MMRIDRAAAGRRGPRAGHGAEVAQAIITSDTRPKRSAIEFELGGHTVRIGGCVKGAGMIPQHGHHAGSSPPMPTSPPTRCAKACWSASEERFNRITIDGDMSTNDTVLVLANGLAGNARLTDPSPNLALLRGGPHRPLRRDGPRHGGRRRGGHPLCEVVVAGAPAEVAARDVARAIAHSPLVKASLFGANPNWGRVLATVGSRAGSQSWPIDPYKARVSLQGVVVFSSGAPTDFDVEALRTGCASRGWTCWWSSPTARPAPPRGGATSPTTT